MAGLAGLLASTLAVATPAMSASAAPGDVTTDISFATDCIGEASGIALPQSNAMAFATTAPASVAPGASFTTRIAPKQASFPDKQTTPFGQVTVNTLKNIDVMYTLPTNATVNSVTIVAGTAAGISGTPTVSIDTTFSPARIVVRIASVPKNMTPPTNETFFTFPAIDLSLTATGTDGQSISNRVAGTDRATAGYVFQSEATFAGLPQTADVDCWAAGGAPAPALSSTTIASSSSVPTTTTLAVDPLELPAGYDATFTAAVSTTTGVVRFNDGSTVLGYAEVDDSGVATLTASLDTVGQRSIVAKYLGSGGFEPSTSDPVVVDVTDPAERTQVQLSIVADPPRAISYAGEPGFATVAVTALPVVASEVAVTGTVSLYDNGALLETQPLDASTVMFFVSPTVEGHQLRAEYHGDTNYFPAKGTTPLPTLLNTADEFAPGTDVAITESTVGLNGGVGDIGADGVLNGGYRTDGEGGQTLDGVLAFGPTTLVVPGGTITGQFGQIGAATGHIDAGTDADAFLDTTLFFQVTEADLGSGTVSFQSGCAVGPIDVDLDGSRAGTDGELVLTDSDFAVPFPSFGSCVTGDGSSLAAAVGIRLAGGNTDLSITLSPPGPAEAIVVAPVETDLTTSAAGQPVQLSTSISQADGGEFDAGTYPGMVEFYVNGDLIASGSFDGEGGPSLETSVSAPFFGIPALPVGDNELTARFVPDNPYRLIFATSAVSDPTEYVVTPAIAKTPVELALDVPEQASAGEVVTVGVTLNPAPDTISGPAPLAGRIKIFDDAAAGGPAEIPMNPGNGGGLDVPDGSDGHFSTKIALAPGEHQLRAAFVPEQFASAWYWDAGSSDIETHTVTGSTIPTSLTIVSEATQGTHQLSGIQMRMSVQLDPAMAAAGGTLPGYLQFAVDGAAPSLAQLDASGKAEASFFDFGGPGLRTVVVTYDPSFRYINSNIAMGNQGFAPSTTEFQYEKVAIGGSALATGTSTPTITPSPALGGSTWSGVESFVTLGAQGTVEYTARNVDTDVVTSLGTPVAVSSATGSALLAAPAPSATLPAGSYEVTASFTPDDPLAWVASTSQPRLVRVVAAGSPIASTTTLTAAPASPSIPGAPVVLEATVGPDVVGGGTIEFFDGVDSLGSVTVAEGTASTIVFGPQVGTHTFTATFTPADDDVVTGSTSAAVPYNVEVGPPSPPSSVIAFPGGRQATVDWDAPSLDGGSPVTGYTITATPGGRVTHTSPEVTLAEVIGLIPGTEYTFTVTAQNDEGSSLGAESNAVVVLPAALSFSDVPSTHAFFNEITWLGGTGITTGYPDGSFKPTGTVARQSMAAFLYRYAGEPNGEDPTCTTAPFTDVPVTATFCGEIAWLATTGITTGYPDGSFKPTGTVARQSMAAFLYRFAGEPNGEDPTCATAPFADVPVTATFCGEIAWLADAGITTGFPNNTFKPGDRVARQAMAAFLYRYSLVEGPADL